MSLTHVCVWDPKIGYRRVSIDEACALHPYGVSARSGYFVCELCAQNVLLTAPGANVQHFRHDPSSPNKECDERQSSFDPTYGRFLHGLSSHIMPLHIQMAGTKFILQLGFFSPPDSKARCEKIKIATDSHQVFEYSFERIARIGTTYLDAELKAYPTITNSLSTEGGRLYKLYSQERTQLISLGKAGALGFSYLIKQPLNKKAEAPLIKITDQDGNELNEGIYTKLPKSKLVSIVSQYDGKAVVFRNGELKYISRLLQLDYGTFLQCVKTISSVLVEQADGVPVFPQSLLTAKMVHTIHFIFPIQSRCFGAIPEDRGLILEVKKLSSVI